MIDLAHGGVSQTYVYVVVIGGRNMYSDCKRWVLESLTEKLCCALMKYLPGRETSTA